MFRSIVLILVTPENKILLEKKPMDHKNEPGLVLLPGGHIEEGEEPLEAAKRELEEEFTIRGVDFELVKHLESHKTKTGKEFEVFFYVVKNWNGDYKIDDYEELVVADFTEEGISIIDIESNREILLEILKKRG